jgi:hypothetical protein
VRHSFCKCIIRNFYILITLFITYFTKESLNKIDDERKEAENKVVLMNNGLEKNHKANKLFNETK